MRVWELPVRTPLSKVFEWCREERAVDRLLCSAVTRTDNRTKVLALGEPSIENLVVSLFGGRLLERKLVSRWPGTKLSSSKYTVFLASFDPSLIKPMAKLGRRIEDWRHIHEPPLPEDLCLFRQGEEWPVLVSVTHERDAWILSEERPPFCLKTPSDLAPEELLIPPAAQGFVGD